MEKDQAQIEIKKIELEKYKAKMTMIRTGVISGLVTIIIAILGGIFSIYESSQNAMHEVDLKKIEIHNTQLTNFIDYALSDDLELKLRLTEYLSILTPSDSQRKRWNDYRQLLLERQSKLKTSAGSPISKNHQLYSDHSSP